MTGANHALIILNIQRKEEGSQSLAFANLAQHKEACQGAGAVMGEKDMAKKKPKILDILTGFSIDSVDGNTDPATISDGLPWTVNGQVGADGTITDMAYQINDGPVNSLTPPATSAGLLSSYSFSLTSDDIPANGSYLLTVYAWDDANNSATRQFNIQFVGGSLTSSPSPWCCS